MNFNYPLFLQKVCSIIILCCGIAPCYAQTDFCIGQKKMLHSTILNEDRAYWISIPKDYNNPKYAKNSFPVIYLLDGETNFQHVVATQDFLSKGLYASIPQMIVVGIINTDRTRDFTPTNAPTERAGQKGLQFQSSGKAENFIAFLQKELIPSIDSAYRTSHYQILIGHSFGGLFTIHTLANYPTLFNAYIAIDPSLWWDGAKLLQDYQVKLKGQKMPYRNLFIASANKKLTPSDTTTDHPRAIEHFGKVIMPQQKFIRWHWKYYQYDDHGTVVQPAISDGLRFLFEGFQLAVKEIPYTPQLIAERIKSTN